jgi:hypothetical protein
MRALGRLLMLAMTLFAAGLALGCQTRLDVERTVALDPDIIKTLEFDGPRYEQKVTVSVSSPDAPVNVYVCLFKDSDAVADAVRASKLSDKVLAKEEKTQDASLQVTIPAKTGMSVILNCASAKAATVKLKFKGG